MSSLPCSFVRPSRPVENEMVADGPTYRPLVEWQRKKGNIAFHSSPPFPPLFLHLPPLRLPLPPSFPTLPLPQWQREKGNPPFPPHRNLTKGVVDGRFETLPFTPGRGGGGEGGGAGGNAAAARPNDDLPPSISQSADYFRRPLLHEWG